MKMIVSVLFFIFSSACLGANDEIALVKAIEKRETNFALFEKNLLNKRFIELHFKPEYVQGRKTPLDYVGVLAAANNKGDYAQTITGLIHAGATDITTLERYDGAERFSSVPSGYLSGIRLVGSKEDLGFCWAGITLSSAVRLGHTGSVKIFLVNGNVKETFINNTFGCEQTLLHLAVNNHKKDAHIEIVKLLLDHGARESINKKDRFDRTPLDIAIQRKHTKIAKLLRKHGAKS